MEMAIYADGDDQYGFALNYIDSIGSGVDVGIYFTQYDSKVLHKIQRSKRYLCW